MKARLALNASELLPRRICGAKTNGNVTANRAVFGLVPRIRSDVTACTPHGVVVQPVVYVAVHRRGDRAVLDTIHVLGTDPTANFQAHIGAGNVIEPDPVQAANLHVLDRFGLDGKISCLRPSYGNETRCRAKEKAFHHLHLEPPNIVS